MPEFEKYVDMIRPLWETQQITNMGCYHQQLEKELQEYLKVDGISLMVNGHMALELAIQAMDFPEGSEIITTPFTFISTTHAIVRNRLTPIFCDIKLDDYTIDEAKIEALITEKTVAILPVHVYGNICAVEKIEKIAYQYNLKVIYDAAHTFGEEYKNHGVGSFGNASVFSFHATKTFNTIEGGAVSFREKWFAERLYNLKNFGIRGEELVVSVGANVKMHEFSAAMGLCNLKIITGEIKARKKLVERYITNLKDVVSFKILKFDRADIKYNYSYFPILCLEEEGCSRNGLYERLREKQIFCRKYFYPLTSEQACFKNKYKNVNLPNAQYVANRILSLPLHGRMTEDDIDKISNMVKEYAT